MAAAPTRTLQRRPVLTAIAAATLTLGLMAGAPAQTAASAPTTDEAIRVLDAQVQVILAEARRQQELLAVQRERLARAEAANAWLPWLAAGMVVLAGLAGGLGLRLWRLRRDTPPPVLAPAATASAPEAGLPPIGTAAFAMPDTSPVPLGPRNAPPAPVAAQPAAASFPAVPQTTGMPPRMTPLQRDRSGVPLSVRDFSMGTNVPPRPVSVEELLDLDQQVDFFLALGQPHSAIDLLLSHVRGTGGSSAPPYFKLLDIYREQGDEEAYERTRERFNQRFNAHAPDWSGDLTSGRQLEHYPEVIQSLQQAWPQPSHAVAAIEALLLRRDDLAPFDLPAYRDLLMLHSLVCDTPPTQVPAPVDAPTTLDLPAAERAARPGDAVDLLLPLGDEPPDSTGLRQPMAEESSAQAMLADWVLSRAVHARRVTPITDRPEPPAPDGGRGPRVDLDLSDQASATHGFTRPVALNDISMRRDKRLADPGGLDEADSNPTPVPSRR